MAIKFAPIAPLRGSFMVASIIGFLVSVVYIGNMKDANGQVYSWAPTWGLTFAIVFAVMFIASIISMTYANVESELHIDEKRKKKK